MAFIFAIQKNKKDKATNFTNIVLQIIRHFKFIEDAKKSKLSFQTLLSRLVLVTSKKSYKNPEYIKKGLTIYSTDHHLIKHPKLKQKYVFDQMQIYNS